MPSHEEVFAKVQEALVDALGVDEEDVTPEATIQGDLDAESIDYLDIVFRLEKAFDIKIDKDELMPQDILTDPKYVADGRLNAEGLAQLKARMPFADLKKFEADPQVVKLGEQLTVGDMVRYVEGKIK
jgi:acyl carrier protein